MSTLQMNLLLVTIILSQSMSSALLNNKVEITCPMNNEPILPTIDESTLNKSLLNSSCFAIGITMNVKNILPDPSYVLPQTNIDIISNVLKQTLIENNINQFNIKSFDNMTDDKGWWIDNQCPQKIDQTVKKYYFPTQQHNITCDHNTLIIHNTNGTIQCQITTLSSMIYVIILDEVQVNITTNCDSVTMKAEIWYGEWWTAISETIHIHNNNTLLHFKFWNTLQSDKTYTLILSVNESNGCIGDKLIRTSPEIINPIILTIAEPNACKFGEKLVNFTEGILYKLCSSLYAHLLDPVSNIVQYQSALYQHHSSQHLMIPSLRRRLQKGSEQVPPPPLSCSGCTFPQLDIIWENITIFPDITCLNFTTIAEPCFDFTIIHVFYATLDGVLPSHWPKIIFDEYPSYSQCISVDQDTRRIFSVGGQQNEIAVDRLKVYKIDETTIGHVVKKYTNLTLDKPRAASMCFYHNEYMIAINGVNNTEYLNDTDFWYNDIKFIQINKDEEDDKGNIELAQINLKYNVIDMRPYITETNILYLFGGRDDHNATNYIQIIDLNHIFNASITDIKSHTFTTFDRMEPLAFKRVIPFVYFTEILNNEPCIMIVGGQDFINNEWINISIPIDKLQLYCNQMLHNNYTSNNIEFTQYDRDNLRLTDEFIPQNYSNDIFVTTYNFTNDNDIWYKFSTHFQFCFDNQNDVKTAINIFKTIINNDNYYNTLANKILIESKKNFRDWSYGFGKINITNITIFTSHIGYPTISPSVSTQPTPEPVWLTTPTHSCNDRCDAFSSTVEDYYYPTDDSICIVYNVKRLIYDGYYCSSPIKYLILGICDDDNIIDIDDLNGLIQSFNIISGWDRYPGWRTKDHSKSKDSSPKRKPKPKPEPKQAPKRRPSSKSSDRSSDKKRYWARNQQDSDSSDSDRRRMAWYDNGGSRAYSKHCFAANSNGLYGIMINIEIEIEMTFEICFKDVFNSPLQFSNNVRFRRGYHKFTCYNNDWIIGLPCIDSLKFISNRGAYDSQGFNRHGSQYGGWYKKGRKRKYKSKDKRYRYGNNAEGFGVQVVDNTDLKTKNVLNRWEVLSSIVLVGLCFIGVVTYCLILKRKKKFTKVTTMENCDDENENKIEEWNVDDIDQMENDSDDNNTKHKKTVQMKFTRKKYDLVEMLSDRNEADSDDETTIDYTISTRM